MKTDKRLVSHALNLDRKAIVCISSAKYPGSEERRSSLARSAALFYWVHVRVPRADGAIAPSQRHHDVPFCPTPGPPLPA